MWNSVMWSLLRKMTHGNPCTNAVSWGLLGGLWVPGKLGGLGLIFKCAPSPANLLLIFLPPFRHPFFYFGNEVSLSLPHSWDCRRTPSCLVIKHINLCTLILSYACVTKIFTLAAEEYMRWGIKRKLNWAKTWNNLAEKYNFRSRKYYV